MKPHLLRVQQPLCGLSRTYQLTAPYIATLARSTAIYKDQRFSDHAPLTVDYDFAL